MAFEDDLTSLLEDVFDWLEADNPKLLCYGDINLRNAVERYFYFSILRNPTALQPLIPLVGSWRYCVRQEQLKYCYDGLAAKVSGFSYAKFVSHMMALVQFFIWAIRGIFKRDVTISVQQIPVGLFTYSDRFVFFFKDLITSLKNERCVMLAFDGMVDELKVHQVGAELIIPQSGILEWSKVRMPLFHPLFPVYMLVLKSFLLSRNMLVRSCPKVLLFAEGTSLEDEVMAKAAKSLGIPTIRLQSGRAGVLHTGYRRMDFDKMLCWGPAFADRLKEYSPLPEYIVTGSPLLDHRDELVHKYELSKAGTISFFTQPISMHIGADNYDQLVHLAKDILHMEKQVQLQVRKHPADNAFGFDELAQEFPRRINIVDNETSSLAETLASSCAAIGFYSTTLSEAAAYGVVPIILKLQEGYSVFPYPEKYGAAVVVDNNDEALKWVARILHRPDTLKVIREKMLAFTEDFFGPRDGLAMQRIVESVMESAYSKEPHANSQ